MPAGVIFTAVSRWRHRIGRRTAWCHAALLAWLIWTPLLPAAPAPLKQFDVFVGYDNIIVSGAWVPLTFEMLNEGPTFKGVLEIRTSQFKSGTVRRVPIELPTGTRKRLCVPVFVEGYYGQMWDIYLRDADGQIREERTQVRPRWQVANDTVLLGALPKSVGGMPVFPEVNRVYSRLQPVAARLTSELFPDHPLAMEGLTALYLNAEKAGELREPQVRALLAWVHQGGHLIVGLHGPSDAKAAPWLERLLPLQPTGMEKMNFIVGLTEWTRTSHIRIYSPAGHMLAAHPGFAEFVRLDSGQASLAGVVVTGEVKEGRILALHEGQPLVVSAQRGRGLVTVLTFAPELEPFRSWAPRRYFFAKLLELPPHYYQTTASSSQSQPRYNLGFTDGLMSFITDSRQIRQLPLGWLVVLLVGYLAVIGPMDYYLLRKLKRPMLTWITFPTYVVLFSGLIYWVGYKLRAGEREWNEIHVADIHPREQGGAQIRGWNFIGAYAPANLTYPVASAAPVASLRNEYRLYTDPSFWSQKQMEVVQEGDTFKGAVSVPVWTSQMYVEEYWQSTRQAPLTASLIQDQGTWKVQVRNQLKLPLAAVMVLSENCVTSLPRIGPEKTVVFPLDNNTNLAHYLTNTIVPLWNCIGLRFHDHPEFAPFDMQPEDWLKWTIAASCASSFDSRGKDQIITHTPFFDLGLCLKRGNVVVLAAVDEHIPKAPLLNQPAQTKRGFRHTVYRLVLSRPNPPTQAAGEAPPPPQPTTRDVPRMGLTTD